MPQFVHYLDIILNSQDVVQTVTLYEYIKKPNQLSLVGSKSKNTIPIGVGAMDLVGLTWILLDGEDE